MVKFAELAASVEAVGVEAIAVDASAAVWKLSSGVAGGSGERRRQ